MQGYYPQHAAPYVAAVDGSFGDYLRGAIENAGITQAELARATGISEAVISRWLRDANQPDIHNLRKLAGPLKVDLLDLVVAAGHLEPAEAKMKGRPAVPARDISEVEIALVRALRRLDADSLDAAAQAMTAAAKVAALRELDDPGRAVPELADPAIYVDVPIAISLEGGTVHMDVGLESLPDTELEQALARNLTEERRLVISPRFGSGKSNMVALLKSLIDSGQLGPTITEYSGANRAGRRARAHGKAKKDLPAPNQTGD